MKIRLNRQLLKVAACLLAALALFLVGTLAFRIWEEGKTRVPTDDGGVSTDKPMGEPADPQSNNDPQRKDIDTVLLIGIDKYLKEELSQGVQGEFEQSDFLMLLVIDKKAERCTAVHINRDTMTDYPVISNAGRRLTSVYGQITLAHTYGGNAVLRCRNTMEAVSNLFGGVEIDHYIELGMDGLVALNEIAGGVTVQVLDDFSKVDESLRQGETVTLHGEQALTYVRARKDLEDSSNLHRMERQRQYLEALQEQLARRASENADFASSALLEVNEYMESDCTVNELSTLVDWLGRFGVSEYRTLEGESVRGADHMEYYVDKDALQALVMELFYEPQTKIGEDETGQ